MNAPPWPDFSVERSDHIETNQDIWRGSTDTGRPVTPVFSVMVMAKRGSLDEGTAREVLRERFDRAYAKAHPNGCPATHG